MDAAQRNPVSVRRMDIAPMDTLGSRIRQAREQKGLSQGELARRVGIRQPSIQALESGSTRSTRHLLQIANVLNVSPDWLAYGAPSGNIINRPVTEVTRAAGYKGEIHIGQMPRDLPIFGSGACGEDGLFEFQGTAIDHAKRPPRLMGVFGAYALYVSCDSMSPWREHGDLVYVNPTQPAKIGDFVVIQLKPETEGSPKPSYIKRLLRRSASEVRVLQYNPRKEITIKTNRIDTIHRILDWSELMGI